MDETKGGLRASKAIAFHEVWAKLWYVVNTKKPPHFVPKSPPFWRKMHQKIPKNVPETPHLGGLVHLGGCTGCFWFISGGFSVFGRGFFGTFWWVFW